MTVKIELCIFDQIEKVKTMDISDKGYFVCLKAIIDAELWDDLNLFVKKCTNDQTITECLKIAFRDGKQSLFDWLCAHEFRPKALSSNDQQEIVDNLHVSMSHSLIKFMKGTTLASDVAFIHLLIMKFLDFQLPSHIDILFGIIDNHANGRIAKAGAIYNTHRLKGYQEAIKVAECLGLSIFNEIVVMIAIKKDDRDFLSLAFNDSKWIPNAQILNASLNMQPPYTAFFDHPRLDKEVAKKVLIDHYVKGNELLSRFWPEAQEAPLKKHCVPSSDVL